MIGLRDGLIEALQLKPFSDNLSAEAVLPNRKSKVSCPKQH